MTSPEYSELQELVLEVELRRPVEKSWPSESLLTHGHAREGKHSLGEAVPGDMAQPHH